MTTTRRRLILGTAALGAGTLCLPRWGRAAEFSYKYGGNLPATHPLSLRMASAAKTILEQTGGRLDIQVFPNNQLGGDTDMLSQVRSGALEFMTLSGLILSTLVPVAAINGVGFAFKDYDQVWAAMDGALGGYVRQAVDKAGLHAFDREWDNGYRQTTTSTKPIADPGDFAGMKLRVPAAPLWTSMFKAFGAAPATINFAETYSALQTHIVAGQENPLAVISTAKLYEVQKYCSMTNHMWDGYWLLANTDAWQALPANVRDIATTAFNDAALQQRVEVRALNDGLSGELEAKGMVMNRPDPTPFRDALRKAGFYSEWQAKFGPEPWALLESAVGNLT